MLYSSSFVGALKSEIQETALELCQLKIKQLSPDILIFRTKREHNPFTFNCSVVSRSFSFAIFPFLRTYVRSEYFDVDELEKLKSLTQNIALSNYSFKQNLAESSGRRGLLFIENHISYEIHSNLAEINMSSKPLLLKGSK